MIDQHAKGRRRKIEVPTDTQPQFELGDTAEDIERRRRERDEKEERERREQEERDREDGENEEGREPGKGREARTDTDTDVESTQSRQKKVSDHFPEWFRRRSHRGVCGQVEEGLWEQLAATRNLHVKTVKKWFETQSTRYGKLTQFQFSMRSHQKKGSTKGRQPPVMTTTTSAGPVLDQFQQMRSIISTFLGARQDPTPCPRQSFCNYLHSEIKYLEERDFLTFMNDPVKLLSEIQYKAEERKRQVTISQQVTTYQLPEVDHSRT